MEWIRVKDRKPDEDTMCYVTNARFGVEGILACYHKNYDVFVEYNVKAHNSHCLDVTHWVKTPDPYETTKDWLEETKGK